MKLSAAPVLWGVIAFLLFPACSEEENLPPPRQKQKVVRPAGIPAGTPGIPAIEKEKPVSVAVEKQEAPQQAPQEAPVEKKETVKEVASETRPPTTKKEAPAEKAEPRDGDHVVRDGESLTAIAGRMEGYKDPLKWIILLRFNLEALGRWPEAPDFADRNLPQGTRLKIAMPRPPMSGGKEADSLWVANVMSARSNEEIVPLAVRLARKGFPVYLTRTQVKGQEWMRLRVGFFAGRAEAQEVGRRIKEAVPAGDPWILKAGKEEYDEFAGFLERESGS